MTDPFGTAQIRERVLAGWAAAPVRMREDANAEEDLVLGGYRDRLVVELAQNASDAAARAGRPGRLCLTLREQPEGAPVLVAANTGEPLTGEGVQSLATLRASAKADDGRSVGRFGVGFAATLAVSDEPMVLSRTGGVRFSRDDTAALVVQAGESAPALEAELRRRDGHVPVLRLPFAAVGVVPDDYDTAVVLPLRDEVAADAVREQLAGLGDALLLALPALDEVVTDVDGVVRTLSGARDRWHVVTRSGTWTSAERAELLADRPTEERRQAGWQVLWALPRDRATSVPPTVFAPTASDEPAGLPALLLATFPLDPSRRHVQPGPLADRITREAAAGYVDLLRGRAQAGDDVLPLVPTGVAAGALDGALRERVLASLPTVPILRGVEDGDLLRPRDAVVLEGAGTGAAVGTGAGADDPAVLAALAPVVAGLVAAPRRARAALAALDVGRIALSDVVDALPTRGEPSVWRDLYAGLAPLADDANARESLSSIPVPLVDGRVVRGVRGLLMPTAGLVATILEPLQQFGMRLVHPDAAHPLLLRLGAVQATARSLLEDGATRAAVEASPESEDPRELAHAVLALVDAAGRGGALEPAAFDWLGDLALSDDEGGLAPAGALALPGSAAARLLDADDVGVLDGDLVATWSVSTLTAVGVLDGLAVVVAADVDLADPPEQLAGLDGFASWVDELVGGDVPGSVGELLAVRDLDAVRADSWPEAVQHLAGDPLRRRALVDRARVLSRSGEVSNGPSYTAWWLRRELRLAGTVAHVGSRLAGLLDPAPEWTADLDEGVRRALGVVDDLTDEPVGADVARTLLDRLADVDRAVDAATCLLVWRALATAAVSGGLEDVDAPSRTRVLTGPDHGGSFGGESFGGGSFGGGSVVVDTDSVHVADDPRWLQRGDLGGLVVAPHAAAAALAELLDVPLASDLAAGRVDSTGDQTPVPPAVHAVLPTAATTWHAHDELTVDGHGVDWWVDDAGGVHAQTTDGLARALAWAAGAWDERAVVAALLADPDDAMRLAVEAAAG